MNSLEQFKWANAFTNDFIANYWEQDPGLFTYPSSQPFVSLEELFQAVINMPNFGPSDRFWIAKQDPPVTYDDFRRLQGRELEMFGPKLADGSLHGFFDRMSNHRFGVNLHSLGRGLAVIDERMAAIVEGLLQAGLPTKPSPKGWVSDTFFGTYSATPFGIHRDPASVFALCLFGERVYYAWPMEYFSENHPDLQRPDWQSIEAHIPFAEVFKVKPGDLFYWPSNRWHVATSRGGASVVVQLSSYFDAADVAQ